MDINNFDILNTIKLLYEVIKIGHSIWSLVNEFIKKCVVLDIHEVWITNT